MKLSDLEPQFLKYETRVETWDIVDGDQDTWGERGCPTIKKTGPREYRVFVDNLADAQGLTFLCPKCFEKSGVVGCHHCEVTFADRGVPSDCGTHNKDGEAVRWSVVGDGYHNLTTTPSILMQGGCEWHGFITNGEMTN